MTPAPGIPALLLPAVRPLPCRNAHRYNANRAAPHQYSNRPVLPATGPLKPVRFAPAMTSTSPVPWPIAQSKHRPPREPAPAIIVKRHGVPTPPWSAIQCGSTRPASALPAGTSASSFSGTKDCSQSCTPGGWLPQPGTVCDGIAFEQTRTYDDCSTANRQATGTKNCNNQCSATTWSPDTGSKCSGQVFTQSRTLSDCTTGTRNANGSKYCPPTCTATGWAPAASSICQGNSFEQARTNSDCSTETRTITGTKNCQSCTYQNWTPSTSSVCSGDTFTQTRTLGNCTRETQSATGTKNCPQTCSTTTWSPSQSLYCTSDQFTQTRTVSNCTIDTRTVYGTKHCPPPTCQYQAGSWTGPDAASICRGNSGTQSRSVTPTNQPCIGGTRPSASRTVSGTMDCSLPTCRWSTGPWTGDSPASICQGSTGSQSRTVTLTNSPCEGGTAPRSTQSVSGTRNCRPTCQWNTGPWTGDNPANICSGETGSQSRTVTLINSPCQGGTQPASSRPVSGTKNCDRDDEVPPVIVEPPAPKPQACSGGTQCRGHSLWGCINGQWILLSNNPTSCFVP